MANKAIRWEDMDEYWANRSRWVKVKDSCRYYLSELNNLKWWFIHRLHPKHRYNYVYTGLPPGYYDPDVRITCAVFHGALEYLENTEYEVDWDSDPGHAEAWKVLTSAVAWWKENREKVTEELLEGTELEKEQEYHLKRIISVLPYMWYP